MSFRTKIETIKTISLIVTFIVLISLYFILISMHMPIHLNRNSPTCQVVWILKIYWLFIKIMSRKIYLFYKRDISQYWRNLCLEWRNINLAFGNKRDCFLRRGVRSYWSWSKLWLWDKSKDVFPVLGYLI